MSKKELVFSGVILLLVQYIVFQWTFNFGSDKNLIDHVSFAGTIVSIILAIVAIIYSFIQAESQSRTSSQIASQISSLRDIIKDFDASKMKFADELDRIENIAIKLDDVGTHVHESHQEITNVREGVDELLLNLTEQSKLAKIKPIADGSDTESEPTKGKWLLNRLQNATLHTLLFFYALKELNGRSVTEGEMLFKHFAVPLAQVDPDRTTDNYKEKIALSLWSALQIIRILVALDYVRSTGKEDIITVSDELKDFLASPDLEDALLQSSAEKVNAIKNSFLLVQ